MGELNEEQRKRIIKEALKEWLDEKFTTFGKWSLATVASLALVALLYFILWANGWYR